METFFLACFLFGALFTLASVLLGAASHVPGADVGHFGHVGHAGHAPSSGHSASGANGAHGDAGPHGGQAAPRSFAGTFLVPLLNVSSILAFLTWFGAAGFLLLHFGAFSLVIVLLAALLAGLAAATLIALFLRKLLQGERIMNPADYRLEGTLARVTVTIPAGGVGEVVFTKAGTRRSEAARSETGQAIPRGTEVVILSRQHGVASVQSWRQLLGREEAPPPAETSPPALPDAPDLPTAANHLSSDHLTT
jgi:membrane protein implicated in regulation of membrane protease activity